MGEIQSTSIQTQSEGRSTTNECKMETNPFTPTHDNYSLLLTPPPIPQHSLLTPKLKTKLDKQSEIVRVQEQQSDDEITLEIRVTKETSVNKVIAMLNTSHIEIVATSQYITNLPEFVHIWVKDAGNAVKNAVNSHLFGKDVIVTKPRRPRGTKKLVFMRPMTMKDFQTEIQTRFKQDEKILIAHSPNTNCGYRCLLY